MISGLKRQLAALLFSLGAIAACQPDAGAQADDLPVGAGFDFYVLSLSWSPSYCVAEGEDANQRQCSAESRYGFIVHGLWPQFERGYPEYCRTRQPLDIPRERLSGLYDIMPSAALIRHQWRKHGSCSGLDQHSYFQVLREAWKRVAVPDTYWQMGVPQTADPALVEEAFLTANPDLPQDGIAVTCDRRYLREVRICLTKTLDFRSCPEVDSRSCRLDRTVMPSIGDAG